MNELLVIYKYDNEAVLVCDPWGETAYLTKEEYEVYLKNRKKLKQNE
jgi:hypothetical protein